MPVVQCLEDLRTQLNAIAPNRDKSSDGGIGDAAHRERRSSHNPDLTATPEWRDGDSKDEIRARDFDKDLRETGLTMMMVVLWLVRGAKSGEFWWLRYIIYAGQIWHKNNGWIARDYDGDNQHLEHAHVNSDFTQKADDVKNCNYRLEDIPMALTDADKVWIADKIDAAATKAAERVWATRLVRPTGEVDEDGNPRTTSAGDYQRWNDVVNKTTADAAADKVINALKS
jgi:hypothetical protein